MKRYLKITGCIFAGILIMTILAIVGQKIFKTYADTPTKEATVSKVTYEFEAEDINATTGTAHNIRVKSKDESNTSKSLSIPNTITVDNIKYTVDSIGNGTTSALGETTGWESITIPTNITTINANAFKDCTTLKTVSFTKTSKCGKIGEYAFYGCTALSNIKGNESNNRMPSSIIENNNTFLWIISAIIYTSYNSITLIGLTGIMNKYLKNKRECIEVATLTSSIIMALGIIIYLLLINMDKQVEIPMLYIANKFGGIYKYLYSITILIAIFTTAISEGYSFLENVSKNNKSIYRIINIIMCTLAVPISLLGFANLVNIVYPIFGIIGMVQIISILCHR